MKTLGRSASPRAMAAAYWLAPPLLCLAIYWPGLFAWFQSDDFAWLSLRLGVHDWPTLMHALFAPMAQGTIRPWSERGFFLLFEWLFGFHALPFRVWAFLTQCANLTLVAAITWRMTGSRAAGFWASVLWLVNDGLALAMAWTSVYNELLCGFFLLSAFWFLLRYIESGRRADCVWQWALFLLGFGALETNVVYPALAASYTYLCARKAFKTTLPLFVPSAVFFAVHSIIAPMQSTGVYALHFDRALPRTFATYCFKALEPGEFAWWHGRPDALLACLLAVALVGFAVVRARQRDWLPVFCLAWFAILLAPVLPLRDHVSAYYISLPTIGLAMLGGYALVTAWRGAGFPRTAAVALSALYLVLMARADHYQASWLNRRSMADESLVLGVARARQLHPGKTILLDGIDGSLFWSTVYHGAFRDVGVYDVYLTPGSEEAIDSRHEVAEISRFVLPSGPALNAIKSDEVVVYRVGPSRLKAVTTSYEEAALGRLSPEPPRSVDVGNPLMGYLLGPEWYAVDGGSCWMPRYATLRIGGPRSPYEKLYLHGNISPVQIRQGPLPLRVTVDGIRLADTVIEPVGTSFEVALPLPNESVGKKELSIALELGRVFHVPGDQRDLGLSFGVFEIR
jgi:hypothetical protein